MPMSDIKLSVHLTVEHTISGNVFVLILKFSGTLFRQISAVWVKVLAENHMQV